MEPHFSYYLNWRTRRKRKTTNNCIYRVLRIDQHPSVPAPPIWRTKPKQLQTILFSKECSVWIVAFFSQISQVLCQVSTKSSLRKHDNKWQQLNTKTTQTTWKESATLRDGKILCENDEKYIRCKQQNEKSSCHRPEMCFCLFLFCTSTFASCTIDKVSCVTEINQKCSLEMKMNTRSQLVAWPQLVRSIQTKSRPPTLLTMIFLAIFH